MDAITSMFDSDAAKPKAKAARKAIPLNVRAVLWARAAGHCQYTGCNRLLIGDLLSGSPNANLAAIAHIIADSKDGPRGDEILSPRLATDIANLMLLCDVHHRVIDSHDRVHDHPVERLREMKRLHEERVAIVTSITEDQGCHVVRFAARIGVNESPVAKDAIAVSLLPHRYPVDGGWIDLDVATLELADHEPGFWQIHVKNLRKAFAEKVRGRMERGEIKRLAVFGLAPMPLLFELGRLISDISTAEVRQLHKSPKSWAWQGSEPAIEFEVKRPEAFGEIVALKLEVSSGITDERVTGAETFRSGRSPQLVPTTTSCGTQRISRPSPSCSAARWTRSRPATARTLSFTSFRPSRCRSRSRLVDHGSRKRTLPSLSTTRTGRSAASSAPTPSRRSLEP